MWCVFVSHFGQLPRSHLVVKLCDYINQKLFFSKLDQFIVLLSFYLFYWNIVDLPELNKVTFFRLISQFAILVYRYNSGISSVFI